MRTLRNAPISQSYTTEILISRYIPAYHFIFMISDFKTTSGIKNQS